MQYENGEMEYPQYDVFARAAESAKTKSDGLAIVRARVEELQALGTETGITPWLIEESPYQGTYGADAKPNQNRATLVAMLTITLLLAGSMAYETQSGMDYLLASTLRGRKKLLHRKIGLATILTTVVWTVTYGLELHAFLGVCDTTTFSAPVQSLSMLESFPVRCSIGVFLAGLHLFRWLALFACAMLTMLISSGMKRLETAYIATCGVILLPSVLYLFMGLEPLKYLSLGLLIELMPIIQTTYSFASLVLITILPITIGSISFCGLRKKMKS